VSERSRAAQRYPLYLPLVQTLAVVPRKAIGWELALLNMMGVLEGGSGIQVRAGALGK
jgi:hypothetical protein